MFWTDASTSSHNEPRIMKAWLDGSHVTRLVYGRYYVRTPNGLTVDEQSQRIYWTDSTLHKVQSTRFTGGLRHTVVYGSASVPHPFSVATFKVRTKPGHLIWEIVKWLGQKKMFVNTEVTFTFCQFYCYNIRIKQNEDALVKTNFSKESFTTEIARCT